MLFFYLLRNKLWQLIIFGFTFAAAMHAASSFSTLRKKQRGPEGAAELCSWPSAPSGLPPPPLRRLCPELSSPHGPRGGVLLLTLIFVRPCAAPLYGVAALPELPDLLHLCFRRTACRYGETGSMRTNPSLPHSCFQKQKQQATHSASLAAATGIIFIRTPAAPAAYSSPFPRRC